MSEILKEILTDDFLTEIRQKAREAGANINFEALREQARSDSAEAEEKQAERNRVICGIFEGWYK